MNIKRNQIDGILVLTVLEKRFDKIFANDFKDEIKDCILDGSVNLAIDLGSVDYMDSSALGAIVTSYKYLEERGKIVLINPTEPIMQLLKLTRMNLIFPVCNTLDAALKQF